MLDAIIVIVFIIAGAGIGYHSIDLLQASLQTQITNLVAVRFIIGSFGSIIGLATGFKTQTAFRQLERDIREQPVDVVLTKAIGLAIGLLLANLTLAPIFLLPIPENISFIKPMLAILGSIIFALLGIDLANTHGRAFLRLINPNNPESTLVAEGTLKAACAKVLDTSCIIDGRIEELLNTGFIEGQILIPQFVLQELQLLADGANDQKRARGRRGLDILNRMQQAYPKRLIINPTDYDDIQTVDSKLVRFVQEIQGTLLTNDFNLQKVAKLQNVGILNVNDLAQAVRPIYLPGDMIEVKIVKPGKEPDQGVGYLEDGTMVVIEAGEPHVGVEIRVTVTSALQTSAGRMIFAKLHASAVA